MTDVKMCGLNTWACVECGKAFVPKTGYQTCCCERCRLAHYLEERD